MKKRPGHQRIGQILIGIGASNQTQVSESRLIQMKNRSLQRLGEIMVEYGHITQDELQRALSVQCKFDTTGTDS